MKKIKLTREELFDVMEDGQLIKSGNWKYGRTETYIFDQNNAKYKVDVMLHNSEGIVMDYDTIDAIKVKAVEKTIIDWVEDNDA